jgi:hypothetical protein
VFPVARLALTFQRSFHASKKDSSENLSQKSRRKTVFPPYVDEFALKKNNAKRTA